MNVSFPLYRVSPLVEEFTSRFPGMSLLNVLSEFSLPTPLSEHNNSLGVPQKQVTLLFFFISIKTLFADGLLYFMVEKKKSQSDLKLGSAHIF